MATSGSYDFSVDRDDLIKAAMRICGALGQGETPNATDLSDGQLALNMVVKSLQGNSIGMWLNKKTTLFLAAETRSYEIGPTGDNCALTSDIATTALSADAASGVSTITVDSITGIADLDPIGVALDDGTRQWTTVNGTPSGSTIILTDALTDDAADGKTVYAYTSKVQRPLEIVEVRLQSSEDIEIPCDMLSLNAYETLSNKDSEGVPTQVYYDPQTTDSVLYIWPVIANIDYYMNMTFRYPVQDFDAAANNPDFPVEWSRYLKWALASEIAAEHGVSLDDMQYIDSKADGFLDDMENLDRDMGSIFIAPDYSGSGI